MDRPKAHEFCTCYACYEGNPAGRLSNPSYSRVRAQRNAPLLGIVLGHDIGQDHPNLAIKARPCRREVEEGIQNSYSGELCFGGGAKDQACQQHSCDEQEWS